MKKGTYIATVTWKIGSFGTKTAKTQFKVTEYAKPRKAISNRAIMLDEAVPASPSAPAAGK